jgi:hypothetical protein
MHAQELQVWDQFNKCKIGDNFVDNIDDAISKSVVLIAVLDAGYLESPEAQLEMAKYIGVREAEKDAGKVVNIIKVVKRQGDKADEIKRLADRALVMGFLSGADQSGREVEYKRDDPKYLEVIEKIADAINDSIKNEWRHKWLNRIRGFLAMHATHHKIYVPIHGSELNDSRSTLVNQLNGAIRENKQLDNILVIPDAMVSAEFPYDKLADLLAKESKYQDEAIKMLVDASFSSILSVQYDTIGEAEEIKRNTEKQFVAIEAKALAPNSGYLLYFFFNMPQLLASVSPFSYQIENPAYARYANINRVHATSITDFTVRYLAKLVPLIGTPIVEPVVLRKNIYLLRYDKKNLANDEEQMLDEIRSKIINDGYGLFENGDLSPSFAKALEQHKRWLENAHGTIIFRGYTDGNWYRNKQGEIYGALTQLNRLNIQKTVFVHPMQPLRNATSYMAYEFNTPIFSCDPELQAFLMNIQH